MGRVEKGFKVAPWRVLADMRWGRLRRDGRGGRVLWCVVVFCTLRVGWGDGEKIGCAEGWAVGD